MAMHKLSEPVTVESYNPEWVLWFERLSDFLQSGLHQNAVRIDHVGSTAVPGMVAKPIIDIDVVIQKSHFEETKTCLEEVGYSHLGDLGIAGREAFDLVDPELRRQFPPHHLYVCDMESNELHRHIAFREYLRAHPDAADEYSKIKLDLVKRQSGDREKYTQGKESLVRRILEVALQWYQDTPQEGT